jgi:hypothetical protein
LDRNLGRIELASQLRSTGLEIFVHDDIYNPLERDPWIFYDRGKHEMVVVTSDKEFMKLFPHMAGIALGKTTVLFFSKNNWHSRIRGDAFLAAHSRIIHALKKQPSNFIACIGKGGSFGIVDAKPRPSRKFCDSRDWESYIRVCQVEGMQPEVPNDGEKEQTDAAAS